MAVSIDDQYRSLIKFYDGALAVIRSRQRDYAPDGIPLLEVARAAAKSNITVQQSLYQLFHKQLSAWERFVATGVLDSESIQSRLRDAANYCGLFEFYLLHRSRLHRSWDTHFTAVPCQCHVPSLATYGPSSNLCERCCILTWLALHSKT